MNEKDLFNQYVEKMESIDDDYFRNLNRDLLKGQNSYLRMRMKGSSFFNDEWINKIEDCIYELGQIVNNPLEVTTTEGNVTPIERAKKINYESIQHLASHSQYVKEIDENGNVVPAKILSQFHKEELHTYENRFIATFIRRLVLFVEKRYEFIRSTVNFDTKDILYVKNKSIVDGQTVTIETKVTVKKENEDSQSKIGREFVERVETMRSYVNYFYNSPFMKEMKTEKDVRKPILQTNVIRKNPLYHKCYETFLFIEKFGSLGVEYTLDEHYQDFNEKERKAINYILASHLLSLEDTEKSKVYKKATKVYKPRLLSSIDDEIFTYGDLVKGPIEFVRVDPKYTEYLKANEYKSLPKKPNKVEKQYFKEEYQHNKNTEKHVKEVDELLKRIRREIAKWEKIAIKLIDERNVEEAKEAEERLIELRKQEQDILDQKRQEIIAAALADAQEQPKVKKSRAKKVEEFPAIEEPVSEEPTIEEPQNEEVPVVEESPEVEEPKVEEKPLEEEKKEEPKVENESVKKPAKKSAAKKTVKKAKSPAKPKQVKKVEKPKEPEIAGENKEKVKKAPAKKAVRKSEPKVKKEPAKKEPKKAVKKPVKKAAPKKEPVKKVKQEKPETVLDKIPGRFIMKCPRGYFVSENKFSKAKSRAHIFDDFNEAKRYKNLYSGKVVKLQVKENGGEGKETKKQSQKDYRMDSIWCFRRACRCLFSRHH